MTLTLNSNGLNQPNDEQLALDCPYCDVRAHLEPQAVPDFAVVAASKPKHLGMVFQCASCQAPVFLRFAVKNYAQDHIALYQNFVELERRREKFSLSYLPKSTEPLFREALACYSDGHLNAFASMCRRTISSACVALGEGGKIRAFDEAQVAMKLTGLDARHFSKVKQTLFDGPDERTLPHLNRAEAGILLEITKDLLYQLFIRQAKLERALKVRRFFVAENADAG